MGYKITKEPHRLKRSWLGRRRARRSGGFHEALLVLIRILLVVLAETWTHKPRELISREYVKGTTHTESQDT